MPGEIMPPTKVFVGRLTAETKSSDLRKLFERFGEVTECDILGTYGFVHMKTADQADEVIQKLNGHELYGSRISVEHSTGQRGRGSRGGRGGGMRGGNMRGGGGGGFRNSRPPAGMSDRFSPYARPVGYPSMMDRGGYGGYHNDYGMDRRSIPMRSVDTAAYYDDYDRRDPYSSRSAAMSRSSYDSAAYDRRPAVRDPYALASVGGGGMYDRRDDYGDSYNRGRSPPRYQTDPLPISRAAYDPYDRYGGPRGASPPRRYAPQHRELTAVRRY